MREYRPHRPAVLSLGALFLGCFGLNVLLLAELFARWSGPNRGEILWLCLPVLMLLIPAAAGVGWNLYFALATYRIDPLGITRIELRRQTQFLWREIVDFQSGRRGQFGKTWTLTDRGGRKLKVHTGLAERGYGLEGFLDAYLTPLQERKRTQFEITSQVYRYPKAPGILLLLIGLFFISLVAMAFAASVTQPQPGWPAALAVSLLVFGGIGAFCLGKALTVFTYTLRVTGEEIRETSLFSKKILSFPQIAAFYVDEMPMKNGNMQRSTEIIGKNGTKIKLSAILIDYDVLTAALQSRMTAPVLEEGQTAKVVTFSNSRRQQAKFMMLGVPLLVLFAMSLMLVGIYYAQLGGQIRLDREGRKTQGIVIGRWLQHGKSGTAYYLDFNFQVAGHVYQRSSPVSQEDYNKIVKGSPTQVTYVPSDPDISRMATSVGRRKANSDVATTGILALLFIPVGIAMFYQGWKNLRAANTPGETPQ